MSTFHYSNEAFPCLLGGVCLAITTARSGDVRFMIENICAPPSAVWEDAFGLFVFWGFTKPVPVSSEAHAVRLQTALLDNELKLTTAFKPLKSERWYVPGIGGAGIPVPTSPVLDPRDLFKTMASSLQRLDLWRYRSEFDPVKNKELVTQAVSKPLSTLHRDGVVHFEGDIGFEPWEHIIPPDTLVALDPAYLRFLASTTVLEDSTNHYWHKVRDSWMKIPRDELRVHIQAEHIQATHCPEAVAAVISHARLENAVERVDKYPFQESGIFELDGVRYLNLLEHHRPKVLPVLRGTGDKRQDFRKAAPVVNEFLDTSLDTPSQTQVEIVLTWMSSILKALYSGVPTTSPVLVLGHKLNDDTLAVMGGLGMASGRTIVPGATNVPPDDKYRIPGYIFRAGNMPLRFAEAAEAVSNNGSAVVICLHDVVAEKPKGYQVSVRQLEALVGWFDAQGAEFGTIEDLVGGASA